MRKLTKPMEDKICYTFFYRTVSERAQILGAYTFRVNRNPNDKYDENTLTILDAGNYIYDQLLARLQSKYPNPLESVLCIGSLRTLSYDDLPGVLERFSKNQWYVEDIAV